MSPTSQAVRPVIRGSSLRASRRLRLRILASALATVGMNCAGGGIAQRFLHATRESRWELVASIPLQFNAHHPQGLVRINGRFLLSTVEVLEPPRKHGRGHDGTDRSAGRGTAHLIEFGPDGTLTRRISLGEGDVYHPGGIDFDGSAVWVSVAEYRPLSRSIIYRVNPESLAAEEVLRVPDHLGLVAHDPATGFLYAASWGSRRFYRWHLPDPRPGASSRPKEPPRVLTNHSHYIDYQDCRYLGSGLALCSGLAELAGGREGGPVSLGGLELVDLESGTTRHQLPLNLRSDAGFLLSRNAFTVETTPAGLRFYFIPDDGFARLYIYDLHTR